MRMVTTLAAVVCMVATGLLAGPAAGAADAGHPGARMASDVAALVALGPRTAGSEAEEAAAGFVADRLRSLGAQVQVQDVPLGHGDASANVLGRFGDGPMEILVGAHVDSVEGSPGADDNASGVAVVLELARQLAGGDVPIPAGASVTVVAFGAEEGMGGGGGDEDWSRTRSGSLAVGLRAAKRLAPGALTAAWVREVVAGTQGTAPDLPGSPEEGLAGSHDLAEARMAAGALPVWMLSVDAVGVGRDAYALFLEDESSEGAALLRRCSPDAGRPEQPEADVASSDFAPFAAAGVPSALLWRDPNPATHSPGDTRVQPEELEESLGTTVGFVRCALDPFDEQARSRAAYAYGDLLWRPGDPGGLDGWAGAGAPVVEVGTALVSSPEFAAAVAPVGRVYGAATGRAADPATFAAWTPRLRTGGSPVELADSLATTEAWAARWGSLDDVAFVDALYRTLLRREPDPAWAPFWVERLASGASSRAEVLVAFAESDEYRARSGGAVLVAAAYAGLLRRPAEPEAVAAWSGLPVPDLLAALTASAEYRARFGR